MRSTAVGGRTLGRSNPATIVDLEALQAKYGLERSSIVARARELGVGQTVEIYLSRCDPNRGRLMLRHPGLKPRWWNLRVLSERGPHDAIRDTMALVEAVEGGIAFIRSWQAARRAMRLVRRRAPLDVWIDRHPVVVSRQRMVSSRAWSILRRAIHRHNRVGRVADNERAAVAALVAYAWLRRRGYPVELRAEGDDVRSAALFLDRKSLLPDGHLSSDD